MSISRLLGRRRDRLAVARSILAESGADRDELEDLRREVEHDYPAPSPQLLAELMLLRLDSHSRYEDELERQGLDV